jgi:hypothetical protein
MKLLAIIIICCITFNGHLALSAQNETLTSDTLNFRLLINYYNNLSSATTTNQHIVTSIWKIGTLMSLIEWDAVLTQKNNPIWSYEEQQNASKSLKKLDTLTKEKITQENSNYMLNQLFISECHHDVQIHYNALMAAANFGFTTIAKLLIEKGASPAVTINNMSAYTIAQQKLNALEKDKLPFNSEQIKRLKECCEYLSQFNTKKENN